MQVFHLVLAFGTLTAYVVGIVIGIAKRERCPHVINKMLIGLLLLLAGQVLIISNSFVGRFLPVSATTPYFLGVTVILRGLHLGGVVMLCAAALSATTDPYAGKHAISPPFDTGKPYS